MVFPSQSLLKRQLTRAFGGDFHIPAEWDEFLTMVDRAYADFTVDHDLVERALEVSSQELLEVNSEIRAILQSFPDLVFRLGPDGTIRSVKAGSGIELPQPALVGRRMQEGCFPHLDDRFPEILRRVVAERTVLCVEHSDRVPGQESWHEVRLAPLVGDEVLAIARNITERKRDEAKLEVMHKQLAEASRQAGMAEIANNVLHNVGNVLNSVNVSAALIARAMRGSRAGGLAKAVELMHEHHSDLADFLGHDARGKAIPLYLDRLASELAAERRSICDELDVLNKGIDHIKEIVATQQSYAGATSLVQPVQVNELMEDALRISADSMVRHQITVVREFGEIPTLQLDRHLMLQILVNLISNAKNAIDRLPDRPHHIRLRTGIDGSRDEPRLTVRVEDDGEGILPQNAERLFAAGFTTRGNGHGFGLHSCALAAAEMGGTISAHSDGPGKGAVFTLEIPAEASIRFS